MGCSLVRSVVVPSSRKEVFFIALEPHVVRLELQLNTCFPQKGGVPAAPSGTATLLRLSPSYSFYPRPLLAVTDFRYHGLSWLDGRCVKARERIHRAMADARLLANPASRSRVADSDPNCDGFFEISIPSQGSNPLYPPL